AHAAPVRIGARTLRRKPGDAGGREELSSPCPASLMRPAHARKSGPLLVRFIFLKAAEFQALPDSAAQVLNGLAAVAGPAARFDSRSTARWYRPGSKPGTW